MAPDLSIFFNWIKKKNKHTLGSLFRLNFGTLLSLSVAFKQKKMDQLIEFWDQFGSQPLSPEFYRIISYLLLSFDPVSLSGVGFV